MLEYEFTHPKNNDFKININEERVSLIRQTNHTID